MGTARRPVLAADSYAAGAQCRLDVMGDDAVASDERRGAMRHARTGQPAEQTRSQRDERDDHHQDEHRELDRQAEAEEGGRGGGYGAGRHERRSEMRNRDLEDRRHERDEQPEEGSWLEPEQELEHAQKALARQTDAHAIPRGASFAAPFRGAATRTTFDVTVREGWIIRGRVRGLRGAPATACRPASESSTARSTPAGAIASQPASSPCAPARGRRARRSPRRTSLKYARPPRSGWPDSS